MGRMVSRLSHVKGWDPVTDLGTPNFGLLKDLVLNSKVVREWKKEGSFR